MGLGIAYAGAENEQIRSKLIPILNYAKAPLDVITFAAISLGLLYVGSCNEKVAQAIISVLTDRTEAELGEPRACLIPLSLGLLYLGKQESVEATAEVSKKFNEKIRKHCDMTLLSCAYAGTENVLKVENLLGHCSQDLEKGETHQGPAVLGIAMVVMAEESGFEKAIYSLKHLLQYGE